MWTSSISSLSESITWDTTNDYKFGFGRSWVAPAYNADTNIFTLDAPSFYQSDIYSNISSEVDIPKMKFEEYKDDKFCNHRYAVSCNCESDLAQERILKSISIMKSRLMMLCAPYMVKNIECKMTPSVKNNIINAYRKVNMYGKKTPFVACFDEYGRRLSDNIKIDTMRGMDIKIVDPTSYGNNYLVFEAIIPEINIKHQIEESDIPF